MTDDSVLDWAQAERDISRAIDTTVPHSARVWDYWLGGKDHYQADREAADKVQAAFPGITDSVLQLRYFSNRVVRYLAAEVGISQFLDIGTGLPPRIPVHEIALTAAAERRTVYADNDKVVVAHARALLTGPPGTVTHIAATLHDPAALLAAARDCLDFTAPVAILMMSTLGHIGDPSQDGDRMARAIVAHIRDALPAGGYLAIGDLVTHADLDSALDYYNTTGAVPYRTRTPEQLVSFFDGLALTESGMGPACRWRPDPGSFAVPELPAWGAVGLKQ